MYKLHLCLLPLVPGKLLSELTTPVINFRDKSTGRPCDLIFTMKLNFKPLYVNRVMPRIPGYCQGVIYTGVIIKQWRGWIP